MVNSSDEEGDDGGSDLGPIDNSPVAPLPDSELIELGCAPVGLLTLHVTTTTGRNFSVLVESEKTVMHLKKIISKNLKVSKDRICLLHREQVLHEGTLSENGLVNNSKLILTPNVETGLLTQRAENTVMQALETLNDKQVNDFLSGKSPLNLSVRLGDHMMLIQLQLSTLNPSTSQAASIGAGMSFSGGGRIKASAASSSAALTTAKPQQSQHHHHHQCGASGAANGGTLTAGSAPETVGAPGLAGTKQLGNNQHPLPRPQSTSTSPAATTSKAHLLARRPIGSSSVHVDASDDGLEQPVSKRPARLEGARASESLKIPHSCSVASASKTATGNIGTSSIHTTASSLIRNNNDQSTGDNNNSYGCGRNISHTIRDNRSATNFLEDQQQANAEQVQRQNEEMEHDEATKRQQSEGDSSNDSQATASVAVSSPIKSLSQLVLARLMTYDEENTFDAAPVAASETQEGVANRPAVSDGSERARVPDIPECSDPITANLTSCLCRRLDGGGGGDVGKSSKQIVDTVPSGSLEASNPSLLHRTALNPITKHKAKLQGMVKKTPALLAASAAYAGEGGCADEQSESAPSALCTPGARGGEQRPLLYPIERSQQQNTALLGHRVQQEKQQNSIPGSGRPLLFSTVDGAQQNRQPQHEQVHPRPRTKCLTYPLRRPPSPKNPALAEASRNLTQTLRKLSKRVFTCSVGSPTDPPSTEASSSPSAKSAEASSVAASSAQSAACSSSATASASSILPLSTSSAESASSSTPCSSSGERGANSGAIIESMKHHGKGIYSGTFSGTLNPALQDKFGRPKRDISTIIHILNDLLSAAPQCATNETAAQDGSASSSSSGMKIYFDSSAASASASASAEGKGNADTTNGDFAVAGSSGARTPRTYYCKHGHPINRTMGKGITAGRWDPSWFMQSSESSETTLFEETEKVPGPGLASPVKKFSTVVANGIEEASATNQEGTCVGCKLPSVTTSRKGGSSSSGYRSLLLSSVDGSASSTKFPLLQSASLRNTSLKLCKCGAILLVPNGSSAPVDGAAQPRQQCKVCTMKAVEMENSKTKLKLDSLRLIMKQKRERREARKLQSAPYHSTVGGGVSPRAGANDTVPQPNKVAIDPLSSSCQNANVITEQKCNGGTMAIDNSLLPEHEQSLPLQPGKAENDASSTGKEPAHPDAPCPATDQGALVQLTEKKELHGTLQEEPPITSSTTEDDVPFSIPTATVNSDDAISADTSEPTKATPEAPTASSVTDSSSSSSADASTNNGATHMAEEVDSVA